MSRGNVDLKRIARRVAGANETYGIISAFLAKADPNENESRHQMLVEDLDRLGLRFSQFSGKWEGVQERSVAVKGITPETLERLGRKYAQDAVVYVQYGDPKLIRLRA